MAIGVTLRGTLNSGSDLQTYATGAYTPSASVLEVAAISAWHTGASAVPTPTLTNHGTWTLVDSLAYKTTSATAAIFMFVTKTSASPTSLTLSVDFGTTIGACCITSWDCSGTDVADGTALAQIVQTVKTGADLTGTTTGTMTLASPLNTDSRSFLASAHNANEAASESSGWTQIYDAFTGGVPALGTQWHTTAFDTTTDSNWTTSSAYGGIAFEVKALVAAKSPVRRYNQSQAVQRSTRW